MTFIMLAAIAIFSVIGLNYLVRLKTRRRLSALRRRGIYKLELLKKLLTHMQQHRGLSNGELNGDSQLKCRVYDVVKMVEKDWEYLEPVKNDVANHDRFMGIYTHWNRLKVRYSGLSVRNNLEQHNRLIMNLLYLIEDVAESHQLDCIRSDSRGSEVIWKELLETAESIGQVRALGTGIVAAGGCDSIQRIRVRFLNEKIKRMLKELITGLQCSLDNGSSRELIAPILDQVTKTEDSINELITLNETELFSQQGIKISSEDYFSLASRCIEPLMTLFDEGLNRLKPML